MIVHIIHTFVVFIIVFFDEFVNRIGKDEWDV